MRSEPPVEEDHWAAAAEWAEALGADVISSSLGYLDFDLPYTSYTAQDMNGAPPSFSCPLTAGVVALILQAHPTYTVDDFVTVLRGSASQAGAPDTLLGWGIVDAVAAVDMPRPAPMAAVGRR